MLGIADSLNVSVSAAVLLYEARRQRDRQPGRPRLRRWTRPSTSSIIGAGPGRRGGGPQGARARARPWPSSIGAGSAAAVRTSAACRRRRCSHGAARASREPRRLRLAATRRPRATTWSTAPPTPPSPTTRPRPRPRGGGRGRLPRRGRDHGPGPGHGQPRRRDPRAGRPRNVVIAVGSVSKRPPIAGHRDDRRLDQRAGDACPASCREACLILGGGPTGCELAQVYARFGVPTTIVQSGPRLAPTDHPRNSEVVRAALEARRRHGADRGPGCARPRRCRPGRRARHRAG